MFPVSPAGSKCTPRSALLSITTDTIGQAQSGDIVTVQNDLLESRAQYFLQQEVAENVMMVNPVLQAVHGGTNASPIERYAGAIIPDPSPEPLTYTF
jgi:hypothetical protein